MEYHPFEPIIFSDLKIIILGTFPSLKSLEDGFYEVNDFKKKLQKYKELLNS